MRDVTNIQLDELIVHILDPKNPDGMILSECTIPLEDNQPLADYFINHIKNSLKLTTAKAAVFEAIDEEIVSGICNNLLNGTVEIVEGSSKLAEKLYDVIAEDRRINACDLAVCMYRAESNNNTSKYLALLNIEPSEVFRHEMVTDSEGNVYIDFKIEKDVMPTTREKLQKCAFIRNRDSQFDYDMILLDRQKQGQEVAKFFVKDFLGAKPSLDTLQRTKKLYEGLRVAHNNLRPELEPHQNKSLSQAIRVAIQSTHINVETWVEALPISEEHQNVIRQNISQKLPDREFDLDTNYAKTLVKKQSFRGDHGLKITVEATEDEDEKVIKLVERVDDEPGTPPYYRIIIHTETWEEI